MTGYKLVILPGDGIGPEVMMQTKRILDVLEELFNLDFEFIERACGFEYLHRTGVPWAEGTFELCSESADAILLGAIGREDNSKPLPVGEKSPGATIVLGLRSGLDLYANIRPVLLFPNIPHKISGEFQAVWDHKNVNLVIVRENTEDFYISKNEDIIKQLEQLSPSTEERVLDWRIITRPGAERIIKFAFNLAQKRPGAPKDGKSRVTCVDKSNVLNGCRLFRATFNSVAAKYPQIESDFVFVDAFTQAILQTPEHFDVVVTTNLFGDIITDLAAVLQGGLGMAPSANLGDDHGMFEPVHGSAPDIAGENIANPIGMILSTQMMLEWLGKKKNDKALTQSACSLLEAVSGYLTIGQNLPKDLGGEASTQMVADVIIKQLKDKVE